MVEYITHNRDVVTECIYPEAVIMVRAYPHLCAHSDMLRALQSSQMSIKILGPLSPAKSDTFHAILDLFASWKNTPAIVFFVLRNWLTFFFPLQLCLVWWILTNEMCADIKYLSKLRWTLRVNNNNNPPQAWYEAVIPSIKRRKILIKIKRNKSTLTETFFVWSHLGSYNKTKVAHSKVSKIEKAISHQM